MLERATLHVLAEAAEIGLPETALVPTAAYDPFLRFALKRRVQRAIDEAEQKTVQKRGDHVLRVAFLLRHPKTPPTLDPNDQRAVEQAFEALAAEHLRPKAKADAFPKAGAYRASGREEAPTFDLVPKRKKRFWPITTPLVAAVLLGGLVTAGVVAAPYLIPSPVARFRKTPAGRALAEPLTDWISGSRASETRAKLLAPEVRKQVGAPAYDALERALDGVVDVTRSTEPIDAATAPFFANINAANARFSEAKVPALLHGYASGTPGSRYVWITSYFVERRDTLRYDGATFDVAWGRRLDNLNLVDELVYKTTAEDAAILSLDKAEEEFVQVLLSPIATGSPLAPADLELRSQGYPEGSPRAELSKRAGTLVGEEVKHASGLSSAKAEALRLAIARRNESAIGLSRSGYRISASSRIELEPHLVRNLEARASSLTTRDEKLLLEEFLRMNDRMALYRSSIAPAVAVLAELSEEELTGRIEAHGRAATTSVPALGHDNDHPRARALASAELGILARERSCPRLALMRVARLVLDATSYGATDTDAARVSLLALFAELKVMPATEDGVVHFVDDAFLGALKTTLEMPQDRVRAAAAAVHRRLFGVPAPTLVRTKR